jgi:SAM-dependent methyltransferase
MRRATLSVAVLCLLAVTMRAQSDAAFWDKFFSRDSYVFGTDPVPLLKEYVHMFRRGRALDLAMGEGRNAVFLAQQGFDVTGVDFSKQAIEKTRKLAASRGVAVHAIEADLRAFSIERASYDLITNIYYPQRHLFDQIKAGLKPGGIFVYEQWHPYGWKTRLANDRAAPPKAEEAGLFQYSDLQFEELARIFSDYQILVYREEVVDQSIAIGSRRGVMLTEVSSLIAKKAF